MPKKIVGMFLSAILVFIVAVHPISAASKTTKVKVTFISAELVENNHVGNEWWSGGYINGKEIEEGKSVVLNLKASDSIKLKAEAQEQDKYPDNGEANTVVKVSSITKTINKSLKVKVVENRGRYSGNTATWEFTFKVQRV